METTTFKNYEELYGKFVSMNDRFESVHIWNEELAYRNKGKWTPKIIDKETFKNNLEQDKKDIFIISERVLENNVERVDKYLNGEIGHIGYFLGCVMQSTGDRANAEFALDLLEILIQEYK